MVKNRKVYQLRDVLITAIAAVVIALAIRLFVLTAFVIPSHSMENTLLAGDNILVSKIALLFSSLERGDVIVFNLPDSLRGSAPNEPLIKRVIGLAGDTVLLTRNATFVNGTRLPNPPHAATTQLMRRGRKRIIVPRGHIFVLGDNRENSWDSRFWGCLPEENIVGLPFLIFWSKGPNKRDSTDHIRWERILRSVE